jgi:hypothetical protein
MSKATPDTDPALPTGLQKPLERFAGHKVQRLLGFCWTVQALGGWENVAAQPFWTEGSVQRWRLEFREVFGCEAEDYCPEVGVTLRNLYYGEGNTHKTPGGKAKQDQAAAELKALKRTSKARTAKNASLSEPGTLHEALGTVQA